MSLSQLAGCNRLHDNEQRLARWLLMAQDRTNTDTLHFTQEFLAMMLGARRTTVTLIAGVLQRQGLIKYQRGRVKILDRAELEAASCDCYQITKELYASLYSQRGTRRRMLMAEASVGGAGDRRRGRASGQAAGNGDGVAAKSGHKALSGEREERGWARGGGEEGFDALEALDCGLVCGDGGETEG